MPVEEPRAGSYSLGYCERYRRWNLPPVQIAVLFQFIRIGQEPSRCFAWCYSSMKIRLSILKSEAKGHPVSVVQTCNFGVPILAEELDRNRASLSLSSTTLASTEDAAPADCGARSGQR
jgi:hypothetical protein